MVLSVRDALNEVSGWEKGARERHFGEVSEASQQIHQLEEAVKALKAQLEAAQRHRDELKVREKELQQETVKRSYRAIFGALTEQSMGIRDRSLAWSRWCMARERALEAAFSNGEARDLKNEFDQFKRELEPNLSSLPESYRGVLEKHHAGVAARIEQIRGEVLATLPRDLGEDMVVEVVFATERLDPEVELLMLVLPLEEGTQTPGTLMFDMVESVEMALADVCAQLGVDGPDLAYGGHQGLLAIETEIRGSEGRLLTALSVVLGSSESMVGAGVEWLACPVEPDQLLPADGTHG